MFGFLYADTTEECANILHGDRCSLLLPEHVREKTGMDRITGIWQDGVIVSDDGKHDPFELVAIWNRNEYVLEDYELFGTAFRFYRGNQLKKMLHSDDPVKKVDRETAINRRVGIDYAGSNREADSIAYPIRMVSPRFTGFYEDLKFPSYNDPFHGFTRGTREDAVNAPFFMCSEEYKKFFTGKD